MPLNNRCRDINKLYPTGVHTINYTQQGSIILQITHLLPELPEIKLGSVRLQVGYPFFRALSDFWKLERIGYSVGTCSPSNKWILQANAFITRTLQTSYDSNMILSLGVGTKIAWFCKPNTLNLDRSPTRRDSLPIASLR